MIVVLRRAWCKCGHFFARWPSTTCDGAWPHGACSGRDHGPTKHVRQASLPGVDRAVGEEHG